jgi:phosphoribosylformimino-5-aminoimidazole carboxamide ribotide isomerase
VIYTDIGRDGMLTGINIEATVKLAQALTHPGHRLGRPGQPWPTSRPCARWRRGHQGVICGRAIYDRHARLRRRAGRAPS